MSAAPYPGLRPFQREESDIFFGRDRQTDKLLEKLESSSFLAVVGPSGCGKSSLVQAGMIAALESGFMASSGSRWRVAAMRPGDQPLKNLSKALSSDTALESESPEESVGAAYVQATLQRGPLGLVEVLQGTPLPAGTNLLLLVDQFEEIFRYRREVDSNEAHAFVALLLRTAAEQSVPVFVVLTMRSEFLGDCMIFDGLPEAVNESQFLTPRLTRDQLKSAIAGPARVFGGAIEERLVNRILNDMGPDPDHLPLMQHLLMRMWNLANSQSGKPEAARTLSMADYEQAGGFSDALSHHADEAFHDLSETQKRHAETLFRCLSEHGTIRGDMRRVMRMEKVGQIAEATSEEIIEVVEGFRRPDRSFLTPPAGVSLRADSLLDISHESLIRQWEKLRRWARLEAESAETYQQLCLTARRRKTGRANLLGLTDLKYYLDWKKRERPNQAWANQYDEDFDVAMRFLKWSRFKWITLKTTTYSIVIIFLAFLVIKLQPALFPTHPPQPSEPGVYLKESREKGWKLEKEELLVIKFLNEANADSPNRPLTVDQVVGFCLLQDIEPWEPLRWDTLGSCKQFRFLSSRQPGIYLKASGYKGLKLKPELLEKVVLSGGESTEIFTHRPLDFEQIEGACLAHDFRSDKPLSWADLAFCPPDLPEDSFGNRKD